MPRKRNKKTPPPIKYSIKTGDQVRVLVGEWKNAEGVVRSLDRERSSVIV